MEYFRKITWLVISNTNLVFSFFLSMNHWQPIVTSNGYVRGILLLLPEGGCHIVTKRNDLSNVQLLLFMRLNWTKLGQITALVQVKLRERSQRKKGWDIPSNCSKKRKQLARPSHFAQMADHEELHEAKEEEAEQAKVGASDYESCLYIETWLWIECSNKNAICLCSEHLSYY